MGNEHGEWIMRGLAANDPGRLRTVEELEDYVEQVGFVPLFASDLPGFSIEERTAASAWWSEDPAEDPWLWRQMAADRGRVAYGKFFEGKAGFLSLKWLPYFANARRDGYDFDALWDDGKASNRARKIMELFAAGEELFSWQVRQLAGFGPGGEKNFEGAVTALQMQTYLVIRDFRCRLNKQGLPYGWPVAVYTTPEARWGAAAVTAAYGESPETSRRRIADHLAARWSAATDRQIRRIVGPGIL